MQPFADPFKLNELLFNSTWHARCVGLIARVSSGCDWLIKPRDRSRAAADLDANQERRLRAFLRAPNPSGQNINDLLECIAVDVVSQGNGYLEVIRNGRGRIAELWHIPAVSMRVGVGERGFWQVGQRQDKWGSRFFKSFGDQAAIDNRTGEAATEETPEEHLASEVIHLKAYHPSSKAYGVPWFLSSVLAMQGNRAGAEYNAAFFKNNTIPRKIFVFRGVDAGEEAESEICDWWNLAKGNPHLPLVVAILGEGEDPASAKIDVIDVESQEQDGGFLKYREANRDEIISAHGVPPRMVGVVAPGRLGGKGSDEAARRDFKTFVVEPVQTRLERLVNELLEHEFAIVDWVLKLRDFDLSDHEFALAKSREMRSQVGIGVRTINEARLELGLEPYRDLAAADRPFIQTSAGPLFLDVVGDGVPPATAPRGDESDDDAEGVKSFSVLTGTGEGLADQVADRVVARMEAS